MKIFTHLAKIGEPPQKSVVALGTFDGVHIGHQKIINQAVRLAEENGDLSVVFTFSNHPLSIIDHRRCPPQIATPEYKAELIAALGVDVLLTIPFTKEFLKISSDDFITLLLEYLHPRKVIVGPNYHYGYKGKGNPETLEEAGSKNAFEVLVHPAVYEDHLLVSSTKIRQLIQEGKIERASRLLGRSPRVSGVVVAGDGRGRGLGYPTANIALGRHLVYPGNGIYAVYVHSNGQRYAGVANIGVNPTFNGTTRHIEVFILNFTGNIYGQNIEVDFLAKLRDEKHFAGVDELTKQIALDIEKAGKYFP